MERVVRCGAMGSEPAGGKVLTLMPCIRLMALSGRRARSVRIVLNA